MNIGDRLTRTEFTKTQETYQAIMQELNSKGWSYSEIGDDIIEICKREDVKFPEPTPEEKIQQEIEELKQYLADTDYIYNVIEEEDATVEYYAEVIAKRKQARARIRELENDV